MTLDPLPFAILGAGLAVLWGAMGATAARPIPAAAFMGAALGAAAFAGWCAASAYYAVGLS